MQGNFTFDESRRLTSAVKLPGGVDKPEAIIFIDDIIIFEPDILRFRLTLGNTVHLMTCTNA